MPASSQINYVELPAVDLAETKAFYGAAFGWSWTDYGPTYSASTDGGLEVGLNTAATPGPAHGAGEEAIGPFVLFATDDLETVAADVGSAGGTIVSGPYAFPGGRRFHFRDPSGNILGVYQSD